MTRPYNSRNRVRREDTKTESIMIRATRILKEEVKKLAHPLTLSEYTTAMWQARIDERNKALYRQSQAVPRVPVEGDE